MIAVNFLNCKLTSEKGSSKDARMLLLVPVLVVENKCSFTNRIDQEYIYEILFLRIQTFILLYLARNLFEKRKICNFLMKF